MNTTLELIEDIKKGKMVILVDDEDRENEGDLVIPVDFISAKAVNFMAKEARGLICLSLTEEQVKRLGLSLMVKDEANSSLNNTAFTVTIESAKGVTTGISAADRAHTMKVAANPNSISSDITVPGHVFPIKARKGGVLKRAGHTEGSIDLSVLSECSPAAVICEIMNEDGTMARVPELKEFAKKHKLKIGTIEDLIQYRIETETFIEQTASAHLISSEFQGFDTKVFKNILDGKEHVVLVYGDIDPNQPTLVRVHRSCLLGDVFGSERTNTRKDLVQSLKLIENNKSGVLVYLRSDEMSFALSKKVEKFHFEDENLEIMPSKPMQDYRNYGVGAQILRALGITQINIISNQPSKMIGLKGYGLTIVDSTPLRPNMQSENLLNF